MNDPVNFVDPDGKVLVEAALAVTAGIAAAYAIAYVATRLAEELAVALNPNAEEKIRTETSGALAATAKASAIVPLALGGAAVCEMAAPVATAFAMRNPDIVEGAGEFLGGYVPGPLPTTPLGYAGFALSQVSIPDGAGRPVPEFYQPDGHLVAP